MIRILVADDHSIVRRGLVKILSDDPELRVAAEAGSGPEVLDLVRRARPSSVIAAPTARSARATTWR